MAARLITRSEGHRGTEHTFVDETTIGRDPDNGLILGEPAVSSHHARIYRDPEAGGFLLEDLDSLNGTELDGIPVRGTQRLEGLHVITLAGRLDLIFVGDRPAPAAEATEVDGRDAPTKESPEKVPTEPLTPLSDEEVEAPAAQAPPREQTRVGDEPVVLPPALAGTGGDEPRREQTRVEATPVDLPAALRDDPAALRDEPVADEPAAPGRPEAAAVPGFPPELSAADAPAGPESGSGKSAPRTAPPAVLLVTNLGPLTSLPLRAGENIVGRAAECDVTLESPEVSRRHAIVRVLEDRVLVRDLGSSNGTFVDGSSIDDETEVPAGAELRFGTVASTLVKGTKAEGPA